MKILNIIRFTVSNRCPRCGDGHVFENNNPYNIRNGLAMHKHCPSCNLRYEKETGFFYGAMYMSYGLVAGLFVLFFTVDALFFDLEPLPLFLAFTAVVLALFPVNYRWSRVLWIALFTKYRGKKDPVPSHGHVKRSHVTTELEQPAGAR